MQQCTLSTADSWYRKPPLSAAESSSNDELKNPMTKKIDTPTLQARKSLNVKLLDLTESSYKCYRLIFTF